MLLKEKWGKVKQNPEHETLENKYMVCLHEVFMLRSNIVILKEK